MLLAAERGGGMRGSLGRWGAGLQQILEGSSQNLPDLCSFPFKL